MALRGGVHLLLEHPLVDGRDGPLGAAVDLAVHPLGRAEGVLGDRPAGAARDLLGAVGDLARRALVALTPLLRAVGVLDGHADHRDRQVDARHRRDPRDAPARADDDLAVDALAHDAVGRADVVLALRRDRRRLDAQARLAHRRGGVVHDLVCGLAPLLERQVVAVERDRQADDLRVKDAERLLEQLLSGLVALEDGDRQRFGAHGTASYPLGASPVARVGCTGHGRAVQLVRGFGGAR
jgi:hypothetical protein